jgi:hypothetical protein
MQLAECRWSYEGNGVEVIGTPKDARDAARVSGEM